LIVCALFAKKMANIKNIAFSADGLPAYDPENPTEQTERLSYILAEALLDAESIDLLSPDGETSEGGWLADYYGNISGYRDGEAGALQVLADHVSVIESQYENIILALDTLAITFADGGDIVEAVRDVASSSGVTVDGSGMVVLNGTQLVVSV